MKEYQIGSELEIDSNPIGVYSETDPLKSIVIWGEPDSASVLGQLLPTEISLFFDSFDVSAAREEFREMEAIIREAGTKVIRIKDIFAQNLDGFISAEELPSIPKDLSTLAELIRERGLHYHRQYGIGNIDYLDLIEELLTEDAELYGEKAANRLNWILSLSGGLPMADIFYSRDQSNVLGSAIVMSNMKWPIREYEVGIYRYAYSMLGFEQSMITPRFGNIEGGDMIMHGNTCYIGVGVRTDREAVAQIYEEIGDGLSRNSIRTIAVVEPNLVELNPQEPGEEMDAMHLDTFWMPINDSTVLACMEEVSKRRVERVFKKDEQIVFEDIGAFDNYLQNEGIDVVNITKEEQLNYSTNFLHLGHGRVIVPLSDNARVISQMECHGLEVIPAEIRELVGGYGAIHCMTAALKRG